MIKWSEIAAMRRWTLLGHELRMNPEAPSKVALGIAVSRKRWKRRSGRPTRGLWTQLIWDYNVYHQCTGTIDKRKMKKLVKLAQDKPAWLSFTADLSGKIQQKLEES